MVQKNKVMYEYNSLKSAWPNPPLSSNFPEVLEFLKYTLPEIPADDDEICVTGRDIKDMADPERRMARTILFYKTLMQEFNKQLTVKETVNALYLLFHLTDSSADEIVSLEKKIEGYFDIAETLARQDERFEDQDVARTVNSHFSHLFTQHTGLVALPVGLVKECYDLLLEDGEFRNEYYEFVQKILSIQQEQGMTFDTYLHDYLCHRLFELDLLYNFYEGMDGEILGSGVTLDPFVRTYRDCENRRPLDFLYNYSEGKIAEAIQICSERGENFFDPDKIWTHAGIVREFAGRYSPLVETLIINHAKENRNEPSKAIFLGMGKAGFEVVDAMDRFKEKFPDMEYYGVDIVPFNCEEYDLMPRQFMYDRNGILKAGIVVESREGSLKWVQEDINSPPGNNEIMSQKLPYIDRFSKEKQVEFMQKRRLIKFTQLDLVKKSGHQGGSEGKNNIPGMESDEASNLLGKMDMVYLRGILPLYTGTSARDLIANSLKFGNSEGYYLVLQQLTSLKGYPFCHEAVLWVEPNNGSYRIKPLKLKFRPFEDYVPEEVFFSSQWIDPLDIKEDLLDYWTYN
ncbi:hypothetical protein GF327_01930 [Candidatus Woesearchaeota archaeon]|nr:hypothetical protein [Candidatus Woesearchaeota archaeon]